MNDSSSQDNTDARRDQFEAAWKAGERPSVEAYLDRVAQPQRSAFLNELLQIELWWRREETLSPTIEEYQNRFPEYSESIKIAFRELETKTVDHSVQSTTGNEDATLPLGDNLQPNFEEPTLPPDGDANSFAGSIAGDRIRYFGEYELLNEIARGGMGVVFKARQVKLNRVVALKMILSGQLAGSEEVLRFQTEAEAAANLDHPGIVPIHEIGEHDGQHFFSMGFVDGESLQDKLAAGPIPLREAAEVCRKIAAAIAYAHEKGVIHRDLKPANVLLDPQGEPKVTDFGLAKQVESDSDLTRTGAVMGTPSYMPPEQAAGKTDEIGPLADVYSLGAILYCLLTGRPPFQAATTLDTLLQVMDREPVPPSVLTPQVPRDLETICLKCLEKDPLRRYQAAQDFIDELGRYLNGEPILAHPVSSIERSWRWCRRNPAVAGFIGTAILLVVTIGIGGAVLGITQTEALSAQRKAEQERVNSLVDGALTADVTYVPSLLKQLRQHKREVTETFKKAESSSGDPTHNFRASLALFSFGEGIWKPLGERLHTGSPEEIRAVQQVASAHRETVPMADLWNKLLSAAQVENEDHVLPTAAILAELDASNPQWNSVVAVIAASLVTENSLHRPQWVKMLSGIGPRLVPELAGIFRSDEYTRTQKTAAAEMLVEYAARDLETLVDVLVDSEPEAFEALFAQVRKHANVAVPMLVNELNKEVQRDWASLVVDSAWDTIPSEVRTMIEQNHGKLNERFAYCQTLPLESAEQLVEQLAASGYRLTRFRPYQNDGKVSVACVWTRDGRKQQLRIGLSATEIEELDKQLAADGYAAQDVAGYLQRIDGGLAERYVGVWVQQPSGTMTSRIHAGMSAEKWNEASKAIRGSVGAMQGFRGIDYAKSPFPDFVKYSIVRQFDGNGDVYWNRPSDTVEQYALTENMIDIFITDFTPRIAVAEIAKTSVYEADQKLLTDPDNWTVIDERWQTNSFLRNNEKVLADLNRIINHRIKTTGKDLSEQRRTSGYFAHRAICHARLGNRPEAMKDLSSFGDQPESEFYRAYCFFLLGDEELANEHAANVLALDAWERWWWGAQLYGLASRVFADIDKDKSEVYQQKALALLGRPEIQSQGLRLYYEALAVPLRECPEFWSRVKELKLEQSHGFITIQNPDFESTTLPGIDLAESNATFESVINRGHVPVSISCYRFGDDVVSTSIWHRPFTPESEKEVTAKRQVRAAIALLRLGNANGVLQILRHSEDPRARSYMIHLMPQYGVSPEWMVSELDPEMVDDSVRAGILQTLGSYDFQSMDDGVKVLLRQAAVALRQHSNAGVCSSAEWLLTTWGASRLPESGESDPEPSDADRTSANWIRNDNGDVLVRLTPGSFVAGSNPIRDPDQFGAAEILRRVSIDRNFAICTKTVTLEQYRRFVSEVVEAKHAELPSLEQFRMRFRNEFEGAYRFMSRVVKTDDSPVTTISWQNAALYCNWLSKIDGVETDQWCYEIDASEGPRAAKDCLSRLGYRLPTTEEWEYACRSGTTTRRYFGHSDELLKQYGWFVENSKNRTWPVGLKKPNNFGLFDMYGNVWEWCHDGTKRGGGCYDGGGFWMRSSQPQAGGVHDGTGFRVVRTLPSNVDQQTAAEE